MGLKGWFRTWWSPKHFQVIAVIIITLKCCLPFSLMNVQWSFAGQCVMRAQQIECRRIQLPSVKSASRGLQNVKQCTSHYKHFVVANKVIFHKNMLLMLTWLVYVVIFNELIFLRSLVLISNTINISNYTHINKSSLGSSVIFFWEGPETKKFRKLLFDGN